MPSSRPKIFEIAKKMADPSGSNAYQPHGRPRTRWVTFERWSVRCPLAWTRVRPRAPVQATRPTIQFPGCLSAFVPLCSLTMADSSEAVALGTLGGLGADTLGRQVDSQEPHGPWLRMSEGTCSHWAGHCLLQRRLGPRSAQPERAGDWRGGSPVLEPVLRDLQRPHLAAERLGVPARHPESVPEHVGGVLVPRLPDHLRPQLRPLLAVR